jgi:hypothetical protein
MINNYIEYMPWDEFFKHIRITKKTFFYLSPFWEYKLKNTKIIHEFNILYDNFFKIMLDNNKKWKTDLYDYVIFKGLKWTINKNFAFLKFKNVLDFQKFKKNKNKNYHITKVYYLEGWKIQANIIYPAWIELWRTQYFYKFSKIGILKADQLWLI